MDTVRAFGRTYEVGTMALFMMRSLKFTTDLDLAPSALKLRKLPFIPHSAQAAAGKIIERYRKRAKREGVRP